MPAKRSLFAISIATPKKNIELKVTTILFGYFRQNCRFKRGAGSPPSLPHRGSVGSEVADVASKWSLSTGPSGCTLHLGLVGLVGLGFGFFKP